MQMASLRRTYHILYSLSLLYICVCSHFRDYDPSISELEYILFDASQSISFVFVFCLRIHRFVKPGDVVKDGTKLCTITKEEPNQV